MPYRVNAITGELNVIASADTSSTIPFKVHTDSGTALLLNMSGGNNISTSGSDSTITISLDPTLTVTSLATTDTHQGLVISKADIQANGTNPNIPISITAKGTSPVILGPLVSIDNLNIDGNTLSSTNANGSIILAPKGSGSVQISYGIQNSLIYFGKSGSITNLEPLTDGQLILGSTGNPPKAASLTAGNGITITRGSGSLIIAATADGNVIGPTHTIASNFCAFDNTTGNLIKDSGFSGISFVQAKNNLSDLDNDEKARSNLGVKIGENVQAWSAPLDSISSIDNGIVARTSVDRFSVRELKASSPGIRIVNGNGINGNPSFYLDDDLAAIENLRGRGFATRVGADVWETRSLIAGPGINILNGNGVNANPVISSKSAMVLIQSQQAANSSSIIFSSGLVYKNYMLLMSGVMSTDNHCSLKMLISRDRGRSYITSGYEACAKTASTTTQGLSEIVPCLGNSESLALSGYLLNGSSFTPTGYSLAQSGTISKYSGSIYIFNLGTDDPLMIRGQCIYNSTFNRWYQGDISGCGNSRANAFLIKMCTGTIKAGTFTLYGFKE